MRSRFSRVLLAVAVLAAVAGCGRVDLSNEWPALAEPTGWEPKAGACTNSFAQTSYRNGYTPVDCTFSHTYETVYIGQFTGDAAALPKPPAAGSTARGAAWAECDAKTTEFVGGQWREGRIWVSVSVPSTGSWEGGARWFRCEAAATDSDNSRQTLRSKSLKGELAGASNLRFGCSQRDEGAEPVERACTESHNTEFVGVFNTSESWDEIHKNLASVHQRCRSLIAAYVGVPDDGNMKYRAGSWYFTATKEAWDEGDRGVRCMLWMGKKTFTSSVKGGGAKALPINYA
jgi:Septum formation